MDDELREIVGEDQRDADRREARKLARALAADVIAYHDALKGAGISGELLTTLVMQFNDAWIGSDRAADLEEFAMLFGEGD